MTREAIERQLADDAATWNELTALLDVHPDVNLHAPGSKPWNSRDAYAHLARWLDYSAARLDALVAGKPVPEAGNSVAEINARWEAEDASLSLAEARDRAFRAFATMERAVAAVPPAKWAGELVETGRIEGANHFREHLSYIILSDPRPMPSPQQEEDA